MEDRPTDEVNRQQTADDAWWHMMGVLFRWRIFIVVVTGVAAIAAIIISLQIPDRYRASSRLLLPESQGGGLSSALLGDLSTAARSLLGGGGGDFVRYLAILNSRTVLEDVVKEFDLITVYELGDEEHPQSAAISQLRENIAFPIDDQYEFLSVEVLDESPERAADISNFFVGRLDLVNNQLSSQTAGNFREYVEERYHEAELERAALLDSLAAFQRQYGVYDLEAQTAAYFEQLAALRGVAMQAEIQYEALRSEFGASNPTVQQISALVEAANSSFERALNGSEFIMPVSQEDAPIMIRTYADLTLERTIQEKIIEIIAPLLEQARFEEQSTAEALQIVDPAVAPIEKAEPRRAIIVIATTLSAFLLAAFFTLLYDWWRRRSAVFASRLRQAAVHSRH